MNDFLARLAQRQLSDTVGVSPRLPSRFGPSPPPRIHESIAEDLAAKREPDLSVKADYREQPPSKNDQVQGAGDPDPAPLIHSDPSTAHRSDPIDGTQATQAVELHVLPAAREASPFTAAFRSGPSVDKLPDQIGTLVPTDSGRVTAMAVEPRTHTTSAHADLKTGVHHAEATLREPLVPPYHESHAATLREPLVPVSHDSHADALPRFTAPEVFPTHVEEEPTVVHVSIGRIEVRAVMESAPAAQRPVQKKPKAMSLEEYLERRHGRKR
jgi:hypothetical protein